MGSAAYADGEVTRAPRLDRVEPGVRRGIRRIAVILALLPLVALLAREIRASSTTRCCSGTA